MDVLSQITSDLQNSKGQTLDEFISNTVPPVTNGAGQVISKPDIKEWSPLNDLPLPSFNLNTPITSATKITNSNNQAALDAATNANKLNTETMEQAWEYYLKSIEKLSKENVTSAEKIMQMNENAQINAYNRNLSYIDEYYPRIVKSLAKAGINPILMASRGFGSPGNVSSAASIAAPYVTAPSSVNGFASNVAKVDFDTTRNVLVQMLKNQTDLKEAEIHSTATILASLFSLGGNIGSSLIGAMG